MSCPPAADEPTRLRRRQMRSWSSRGRFAIDESMVKKTRKPLGSFGALSRSGSSSSRSRSSTPRSRQPAPQPRRAPSPRWWSLPRITCSSSPTVAEGSRLMMKDLGGDLAKDDFVGVVARAEAARVLRLYEADAQALQVERPLDANHMRILYLAEGEVTVIDEPLAPDARSCVVPVRPRRSSRKNDARGPGSRELRESHRPRRGISLDRDLITDARSVRDGETR